MVDPLAEVVALLRPAARYSKQVSGTGPWRIRRSDAIFALAILHTFAAARFSALAHRLQHRHDERAHARGRPSTPAIGAELMHFLGEVEVVFGLWALVLLAAMTLYGGWETAKGYFNGTVNYTEPLFVVVIMALASTRPVIAFAEQTVQSRQMKPQVVGIEVLVAADVLKGW